MTTRILIGIGMMAALQANAADRVVIDGAQQTRAGIVVQTVGEGSFASRERVVGAVVQSPGSTIILKSIVSGRLEELRVAPGDRVREGQVVAEIHSHEVLAMQGELLRAAELSALATKRVEAGRELLAVEGISRLDLEVREQEAFSAKLGFDTAYEELLDHGLPQAALDRVLETKTRDPHLPITTPAAGVVLELDVQRHEWVQEYAPLMVIGNPDQVELDLQIAPDRATNIAAGDSVEFAPVGKPDASGRGEVVTRVPQVDPNTRTIRIRARIIDGDPSLFPGVFVEGSVLHGGVRRVASIRESAVIGVGGRDTVFVRVAPDTFEPRAVTLGQTSGGSSEVLAGLQVGDEVAVEGAFFLKSALVKGSGEGE
jgi:cobalt-zinc-cadmium efflux system membrane fusion protein